MNNFSKEEKAMLVSGLEALMDEVREKKKVIGDFVWEGVEMGLIGRSGEDYEKDLHFYEMKDKIRQKLEDHEAEIIKLRNKLFNE